MVEAWIDIEKKQEERQKIMGEWSEEEEGEVEQGDLKDEDIDNLVSYVNCSRNKAIKTLKKTGGDLVEAITLLS